LLCDDRLEIEVEVAEEGCGCAREKANWPISLKLCMSARDDDSNFTAFEVIKLIQLRWFDHFGLTYYSCNTIHTCTRNHKLHLKSIPDPGPSLSIKPVTLPQTLEPTSNSTLNMVSLTSQSRVRASPIVSNHARPISKLSSSFRRRDVYRRQGCRRQECSDRQHDGG
jgi:hypothetical protein